MSHALTLESLRPRFASQYALERELGRGGMGVVFLARELSLDRMVALKVLPPGLADAPEIRERFLREARTAAQLSHPNIVPIFRADWMDGLAYFAMGLVDGETLADRLVARGTLPPAETVRILREVAWALAYAHARGVIHRDVKPENILIERNTGRVVVTDFGIARDTRSTPLTADGMVLGSVHYMSPEQVAGGELDGRSDLYALGIVGFRMLSGKLPFDAPQASAVLLHQATTPPTPLLEVAPGVPPMLAAAIDRCLNKDPDLRPPTGEAFAEALGEALQSAQSGGHSAPERIIDETTARAIWLRAAQLQADASRQVRERSARAEEYVTGLHSAVPTSGYRQGDVEAAAIEAGIAEEYVQLALAELPDDEAALPAKHELSDDRFSRLVLGNIDRSIIVSRVVPASPVRTLEAIGHVLPSDPWGLNFKDTVGGHPLDGGVLTFAARALASGEYFAGSGFSSLRYYLSVIDAYQLRVTLHPIGGDPDRCDVRITVDLRQGLRKNAQVGLGVGGGLGGVGAAMGIASGLMGGMGIAALPIGLGILLVAGGGMLGVFRFAYRWGLKASRRELEHLLDAVVAHTRSMDVFGPPSKHLPRG